MLSETIECQKCFRTNVCVEVIHAFDFIHIIFDIMNSAQVIENLFFLDKLRSTLKTLESYHYNWIQNKNYSRR